MVYAVLVPSDAPAEPPSRPTPRRRRHHSVAMLLVALLGLLGVHVSAGAIGRAIDFLPAVQLGTENARLVVVNLKDLKGGVPPDPCKGAVAFYDGAGTLVAGRTQAFTLAPGASVIVPSLFVNAFGGPVALRARVTFPAAPASGLDTCGGLNASYEVFETQTAQTKLMNPGVIRGFNPQPDPPAFESVDGQ